MDDIDLRKISVVNPRRQARYGVYHEYEIGRINRQSTLRISGANPERKEPVAVIFSRQEARAMFRLTVLNHADIHGNHYAKVMFERE